MKTLIQYKNKVVVDKNVIFDRRHQIAEISKTATVIAVGCCRYPTSYPYMAKVPYWKPFFFGVSNREFLRIMVVQLEDFTFITLYFHKDIDSKFIDTFLPDDKITFTADLISEYNKYSCAFDCKLITTKLELIEHGSLHDGH